MQIRCTHCHRPYALSRENIHGMLDLMDAKEFHYINAPCPHCGRVNKISRDELLRAAPDWQSTPKTTETE